MSWSISLNVYGFCNFGAKNWFNLSLAIIPVLAFIHIEQFFKAYSRQQNQKHPCPPTPPLELHWKTFQLSVSWRPGPSSDFRAGRRHKQPCCSCTGSCVGCAPRQHTERFPASAVCEQSALRGLRGLSASAGFAVRFVPIYRNRAPRTQTNVILLWGVRGVAGFVDFFFFLFWFFSFFPVMLAFCIWSLKQEYL